MHGEGAEPVIKILAQLVIGNRLFTSGRDVVLIARPGAGEAEFAAVAAELGRFFQ